MSGARSHALEIFQTAVDSVMPQTMVARALKISGDDLLVNGKTYRLDRNVHIVAFGKAVAGMVRAAEDVLGDHVVDGIASVPTGIVQSLRDSQRRYGLHMFRGDLGIFLSRQREREADKYIN